jgi:trans-2,3-dihydro-3-hydroxyanthranilate isomerase
VEVPFRLVDVFTDRPLAGNQLCVVPEAMGLDAGLMQALAREIGFSETTFVTEAGGDRYAMRIFTPGVEMPFAGHPSLGTAFVLAAEGRITSPARQVVAAGEFLVEVDIDAERARVRQHEPKFGPMVDDVARTAAAIGLTESDLHPELRPEVVSTGLAHLLVPAKDASVVAWARPEPEALGLLVGALDVTGVYVFSVEGDGEARARFFSAGIGVTEDPATGSAAGPLGAYLSRHGVGGMPGRLRIRQGEEMGRPSELHVDVRTNGESFEVWVEGGVAIVGRGVFEL